MKQGHTPGNRPFSLLTLVFPNPVLRIGTRRNDLTDMRSVATLLFTIAIAFLAVPSVAQADLRQFIPRIYSNEAEIDVDASYTNNRSTSGGNTGLQTQDIFFSERFVFSSLGYVYHPRFLVYFGKIGLGMIQENFENFNVGFVQQNQGWRNTFVYDYDVRAFILPEHPYNLELYTLRLNPYVKSVISSGFSTVNTDTGAIFTYKKRPYKLSLSYNKSTLESTTFTTDTKHLKATGVYFLDWTSFSASYARSDSETTSSGIGTNFTTNSYTLENQLRLLKRNVYLTSAIEGNTFNQEGGTTTYDDKRFTWKEDLSAELPWNFTTGLSYYHFEDTAKTREHDTGREDTLTSTSNTGTFSLVNRLFQSLTTSYNLIYTSTSSTTGDTKGPLQSLSSTYTKNIPIGLLIAGVTYSRSVLDRSGAPAVINEIHTAQIFGEFTLQQPDIDEASISMRVKAPDTGVLVDLTKNTDYLVFPIGNTTRIQIIAIPPQALSSNPFFVQYEFQATYTLVPEHVKVKTTFFGYTVKLELFDHLVNPYYAYGHTQQEVLSGALSGVPLDDTSRVVGVSFQKAPYYLILEYQDYQSTVNPFKMYKIDGTYRDTITETTSLYARAYYNRIRHELGVTQTGSAFNESIFGAEVNLQKAIPKKRLFFGGGASYVQTAGITDTRSYFLNANVTWTSGNLEVRAGAQVGRTEMELNGKQETLSQYYWLSLRRRLF